MLVFDLDFHVTLLKVPVKMCLILYWVVWRRHCQICHRSPTLRHLRNLTGKKCDLPLTQLMTVNAYGPR